LKQEMNMCNMIQKNWGGLNLYLSLPLYIRTVHHALNVFKRWLLVGSHVKGVHYHSLRAVLNNSRRKLLRSRAKMRVTLSRRITAKSNMVALQFVLGPLFDRFAVYIPHYTIVSGHVLQLRLSGCVLTDVVCRRERPTRVAYWPARIPDEP